MNIERINTNLLEEQIDEVISYINILDSIIEKIEINLNDLSINNNTYYSTSSINLNMSYIDNKKKILELHNSLRNFILSSKEIINNYEKTNEKILNNLNKIPPIKIEVSNE